MEKIIFGPVTSRRFGQSLGIDLSPALKQCNFDCVYCELQGAKPVDAMREVVAVDDIISALKEALVKFPDVDVITLTANGEPTLYPHLDILIDKINALKANHKLLILTNGATIVEPRVRKMLAKLDIVKLSLDCVTPKCFKRIDRPYHDIKIEAIIEAMREFRREYKGLLIIEVLVVKGINDKEEEFENISRVLNEINPDRVDVGSIDRPPAYKVEGVDSARLRELAHKIENLNVSIAYRKDYTGEMRDFTQDEILNLLSKRPQSADDVLSTFSQKSQNILKNLVKDEVVKIETIAKTTFYRYKM
ncbi:radical SAM protein [Sulfurospirillum sp. 1612]|uniref:radical SAM protein n=1 Tax=Sulfurospirillum sp. 1612 TaxID=3094835 RepID=UPI002F92745A